MRMRMMACTALGPGQTAKKRTHTASVFTYLSSRIQTMQQEITIQLYANFYILERKFITLQIKCTRQIRRLFYEVIAVVRVFMTEEKLKEKKEGLGFYKGK